MRVSKALIFRMAKVSGSALAVFGFMCIVASLDAPAVAADSCASPNGMFSQSNVYVVVKDGNGIVGYGKGFGFRVKATTKDPAQFAPGGSNPNPDKFDLAHKQKKRLLGQGNELSPPAPRAAINGSAGNPHGSSDYNNGEPSQTVDFNATSSNMHLCNRGGDGIDHPAYDFTDGSNGNPFLDCLGGGIVTSSSVNNKWTFTATYRFTATGAPGSYVDVNNNNNSHDIPSGGWWESSSGDTLSPTSDADVNDLQGNIIFVYRIPTPTPPPHMIGDSTYVTPTANPGQTVTFTSYFQNIGSGSANNINVQQRWGWTGQNPSDNITQQTNHDFAPGQQRVMYDSFQIPSYALNGWQYCRHSASNPWIPSGGLKDDHDNNNGWGDWPACVTVVVPTTEYPPTGWISVAPCTPSSTQHLVSYGGYSDPNGATQGQVSTTLTPGNDVAGPTYSNGTTPRTNSGAVTYYLYVQDTLANGTAGAWNNVASASYNGAACPVTVAIDPYARLTDASGTVLPGSPVTAGTQVRTQSHVYNNGSVSTSSQWTREFWYDNGNAVYDAGETLITATSTGGPTTYAAGTNTTVSTVASTAVDGTKLYICVSLNLYNVATTPTTNITAPNPETDCRAIVPLPNELIPTVNLGTSVIEPGQQLTATAAVTCNPGTNPSSSDYRRIFWYENGGNPSRYDDPSDQLVAPNRDESGNATYCGSNPFTDWSVSVPQAGVTRACTSLQLTSPSANATIPGSGFAVDCADVSTKFFFQVTHGDINAIACLVSCAGAPTISAFNGGSGTSYRGSGSQIAAFATGTISEFTSSNNPASYTVAAGDPKRLTFANTGPNYGGNFTQRYQIPDYWAGATPGNSVVSGVPSEPLIISKTGDIRVTGSKTVSSVGVGNVPNLQWVISEGNIYIDSSVTQLYGVYIAKGNIYTCANGFAPVSLGVPMATNCTNPLKINGALIAGGSVKLQRTHGSLGSGAPAEVIEYNPFVWMQGINPAIPLPTSTSSKLDFITTLPPVL